jgi:hypothetical protein
LALAAWQFDHAGLWNTKVHHRRRSDANFWDGQMTDATSTPPWQPTDLPTLRAAYSDRTAALMAYLASFAYSDSIGAKGRITVPPELAALGFSHITAFHNNLTDGWAYLAESEMLIVLAFRGDAIAS